MRGESLSSLRRNDCGRRHALTGKTPELWTVRYSSLPMENKKDRLDADLWAGTFAHASLETTVLVEPYEHYRE